jgi:1,4-alpha-glucan branching enzyme
MLVMPSLYEPFGMPAAEAGAASKPVVASRTGGLQEIVEDGSTGLLHRPGDHEDLAEKVLRLLGDPELAAEMGRRGRVMRLFSPEVVAAQYLKLYEEVL